MQYGWFALCYVMGLNPNLVPHPGASRVLGAIVSLLMTSVEDMDTFVKSADIVPGMCAPPWYSFSAAQMLLAQSGEGSSLCALQSRKPYVKGLPDILLWTLVLSACIHDCRLAGGDPR